MELRGGGPVANNSFFRPEIANNSFFRPKIAINRPKIAGFWTLELHDKICNKTWYIQHTSVRSYPSLQNALTPTHQTILHDPQLISCKDAAVCSRMHTPWNMNKNGRGGGGRKDSNLNTDYRQACTVLPMRTPPLFSFYFCLSFFFFSYIMRFIQEYRR